MEDLEKKRRETEALLSSLEEDEEGWVELEKEINKFEAWVAQVLPFFSDPSYQPSYEEKRLATRILGVRCTVYPTQGDYPYRTNVDFTIPDIAEKAKCIMRHTRAGMFTRSILSRPLSL